jgi:hypothetical protein
LGFHGRRNDFYLYIYTWDRLGVYHYRSRSDILNDYPAPNITSPPTRTRVLEIEPCSRPEASATCLVEAIRALSMSAGGVCGYHWKGEWKHRPLWTLHLVVDSRGLVEALTKKGGYTKVQAIIDRCQAELTWFDYTVECNEEVARHETIEYYTENG